MVATYSNDVVYPELVVLKAHQNLFEHEDQDATMYKATVFEGPTRSAVVRRMSLDAGTGEVLEDRRAVKRPWFNP